MENHPYPSLPRRGGGSKGAFKRNGFFQTETLSDLGPLLAGSCYSPPSKFKSRSLDISFSSVETFALNVSSNFFSVSDAAWRLRMAVLIFMAARGLLNSWHMVTTSSLIASERFS